MKSLGLYYWRGRNFGDALGPVLVSSMSGMNIRHVRPYWADLMAVGSLMEGRILYRTESEGFSVKSHLKSLVSSPSPLLVWGTGFVGRSEVRTEIRPFRELDVRCVRGPLTLGILRERGLVGQNQDIPVGDPGLLFPRLLSKAPEKKYEIGVVPHFEDLQQGYLLSQSLKNSGASVRFIDVTSADPLGVVREIGECSCILASALHGLIAADAFGIPNIHVRFSFLNRDEATAFFKFEDYFSAVQRPYKPCLHGADLLDRPEACVKLVDAAEAVRESVLSGIQEGLIRSFPYELTPIWALKEEKTECLS